MTPTAVPFIENPYRWIDADNVEITILADDPRHKIVFWMCRAGFLRCAGARFTAYWKGNDFYIALHLPGQVVQFLHQFLLPTDHPLMVDHKDNDRRNNRLSNLRRATRSENKQNSAKAKRVRKTDDAYIFEYERPAMRGSLKTRRALRVIIRKWVDGHYCCASRYFDATKKGRRKALVWRNARLAEIDAGTYEWRRHDFTPETVALAAD